MMQSMVIQMSDRQLQTLAQLQAFLDGTAVVDFAVAAAERCGSIGRTVRRFAYGRLKRAQKAVVLRFLERVSGYSRQQLTRLVKRGAERAPLLKRYGGSRTSFASVYTLADVLLLAHTDSLHGTPSGPATKKLMERAWSLFGDPRYERLAAISVAHLYNLRQRTGYQRHRQRWTKTRPVTIPIGIRRAPAPNNRPGYLRVDSVHQGDQDGLKGIYHINAVDCVTQFEAVATCERISEAYLIPVLEEMLLSFPFVIRGFHSDNGSEYINRHVAEMLNKLLIEEHTKSRSRSRNNTGVSSANRTAGRRQLFLPPRISRLHRTKHVNGGVIVDSSRICRYIEQKLPSSSPLIPRSTTRAERVSQQMSRVDRRLTRRCYMDSIRTMIIVRS
jgi:hypothetical protein